jgi:hypothetical protein
LKARPDLADRIALAILEHGPSAGSALALLVGARKATVLEALRTNRMFERVGNGPGSRWRVAREPIQGAWEPIGRDHWDESGSDDGLDVAERLRALERRVAQLEREASSR